MSSPPATYGDALAVVTTAPCPQPLLDALPAATALPVRVVAAGTAPGEPPPGVQHVDLREEMPRGAAANRVIAGLPAEVGWVAVTAPWVRPAPGALDALLDAAHRHPRAGALGPEVRDGDGRLLPAAGDLPRRRAAARVPAGATGNLTRRAAARVPAGATGNLTRRAAARVPVGAPRVTAPVGWVSGGCVLLRRAAWDSVDGFAPAGGAGPGAIDPVDVDLAARLGRAGWLVVHVPAAAVVAAPLTAATTSP